MKKYVFSIVLFLNIASLFAYDQQAYKDLLAGVKKFENVDLSKAKITNMDLSDVTFENVNLTDAFFNNSMLTNVTFVACNLSKATFYDVIFNNSRILNGSNLMHSNYAKVIFDNSEISGSDLSHTKFLGADFIGSVIRDVNLSLAKAETINFSACTLERINFNSATLELVNIYDTAQFGVDLIFEQTKLSSCSFIGRKEKSSIVTSNFFGVEISNSYFVNVKFDKCTNLNSVGNAYRSLFQDVTSANQNDFQKLKEKGARVNDDWITSDIIDPHGVIKEYWSQFDTHYCKEFFAVLWPTVAQYGAVAAVGIVFPAAAPIAAPIVGAAVGAMAANM